MTVPVLVFAVSFTIGIGVLFVCLSLLRRHIGGRAFGYLAFLPAGTFVAALVAAVPVALAKTPDWTFALTMSLAEGIVVARTIQLGRRLGWRKFTHDKRVFRVVILFACSVLILDALLPGHSWQGRLFDVVTVALYLGMGWRLLRMGVQVEHEGIIIRNALRTQRLLWNEIDRFELGRLGRFKKATWAAARLRDGRAVRIDSSPFDVLAATRLRDVIHGRNLAAETLVDQLNREMRDHGPN
jgi:hypothetical protein